MDLKNTSALRAIIGLDAGTCAVMAALLIAGAGFLSEFLIIPAGLLTAAGAMLVPVALFMAWVAAHHSTPLWTVWVVILGNAGWVIASLALVAGPFIEPTPLGIALVLGQATVVAVLAAAEYTVFMRGLGSVKPVA